MNQAYIIDGVRTPIGNFGGTLAAVRPDDLAGSAGNFQLRAEILRRVNLVAAPGKVDAVLIEEMLVK